MLEPQPAGWSRRSFIQLGVAAGALALTAPTRMLLGANGGDDLTELGLAEASERIRTRKTSPVELTKECLHRVEMLDPLVNAFITVSAEKALAEARQAEKEVGRGGWRGPLHGIPVALKDNIDTAGVRTTAGSAVFLDRVPTDDAEVVRRLKAAGAIILGKLNLDEFAFGHSSTFSHFGPVHNPWKLDHVAGGSSGGSAAAVAARLCYAALGTDTGGSIRTPSAYCGVAGLRPTAGLVSLRGVVPLSPTFDTVGPVARRVADLSRLLSAIARPAPGTDELSKLERVRVGVAAAFVRAIEDSEIRDAVRDAISRMRSLTAGVREIELPRIPETTFGNILLREALVFHDPLLERAAGRYDPVIRSRAEFGRTISQASYAKARGELRRVRREVPRVFSEVDLVIAPSTYVSPATIDQSIREQRVVGRPPLLPTVAFSVYGLPTVSVPCGFTRSGLPIGLQIAGPPFGEMRVLLLAGAYEATAGWHHRAPVLSGSAVG